VLHEERREGWGAAGFPRTDDFALHVEQKALRRIEGGNQRVSLKGPRVVDRQSEFDWSGFRLVLFWRIVLALGRLWLVLALGRLGTVFRPGGDAGRPDGQQNGRRTADVENDSAVSSGAQCHIGGFPSGLVVD